MGRLRIFSGMVTGLHQLGYKAQLASICAILWTLPLHAQFTTLDGFLQRSVDAGNLSAEDADMILAHVELAGWPTSPYEANAIKGLAAGSGAWLAQQPEWRAISTGTAGASDRHRLAVRSDGIWKGGQGLANSLRIGRSGNWAFRWDRSGVNHHHFAGHALLGKSSGRFSGWRLLLGDHVLQWGQGVVGGSASAFDGLRSPTAVVRSTRWVAPMASGESMVTRRGAAAWWDRGRWRAAISQHAGAGKSRLAGTVAHRWDRARLGVAGEVGGGGRWIAGAHGRWNDGPWVVAGEWAGFRGGTAHRLGVVRTTSEHFDVFASWNRGHAGHPGRDWGRTGLDGDGSAWMVGWNWRHPAARRDHTWAALRRDGEGLWRFDLEWVHRQAVASGGGQWTARFRFDLPERPAAWHLGYKWSDEAGFRVRLRWDGRWDPWDAEGRGQVLGCVLGHHPEGAGWSWDLSLLRSDLRPNAQPVYALEPGARGWRTAALRGATTRIVVAGKCRWGKLTGRWSGVWGQSLDSERWGSGAGAGEGANRFGLDVRLSYAL